MSCKVLTLLMMFNGEWVFSDVLKMRKFSRACERKGLCLKEVKKYKDKLTYSCAKKEDK
jgi:hypothetical protein